MMYLLVIFLCLTLFFFYLGFSRKTDHYSVARIQSVAFIFLLLSSVIAFGVYKENNAKDEISKYITPYSGKMEAIYTPAIPGSKSQIWQFETTDTPEQLEIFYSKRENHQGWDVITGFPFMTLRNDTKEIIISVALSKKTSITYELRAIRSH